MPAIFPPSLRESLLVLCLGLPPLCAPLWGHASCLELPTPDIRTLDNLRYADPAQAADAAAARLLPGTPGDTPLVRAELYLVVGFGRAAQSRIAEARTAFDEAGRLTSALPMGAERQRLEMRAAMGAFGVAFTQSAYTLGRENLDRLLGQTTRGSREWTCLLAVRGDFEAETDRLDLAAADQLTSYRTAHDAGWAEAADTAALSLATTYRRSGLWAEADRMIDEVLRFANDRQYTFYQSIAQLTRGQILVDEKKWDEAYAALAAGEALALRLGDTRTAAYAAGPMCKALLNSGRIDEARSLCAAKFADFVKMGRTDLASDSMIFQARIDLVDARYAAALGLLDSLLTERLDDVPRRSRVALYRERAQALSALGRHREAAADLERALTTADAVALTDRQRTVAVLSGLAQSQALESTNRELLRENAAQAEQLRSQRKVRILTAWLAAAGLIVSAMFGHLLLLGRRNRRALARQAEVLDRMSEGVAVVDDAGVVTFANDALHSLLGHPHGSLAETLAESLAADPRTWTQLLAADSPAQVETQLRRQDGTGVLVSIATSRMRFGDRPARIFVFRDITGQRLVERTVAGTTGREALHVGDTLHEGLAQDLTGIALVLQGMTGDLGRIDAAIGASAESLTQHLANAIVTTREVARFVSPGAAAKGALGRILRALADDTARRIGCPATYPRTIDDVDVRGTVADDLYRVARDALRHAERYYDCSTIGIDLQLGLASALLTVTWEGPARSIEPVDGVGLDLEVIRYRTRLLDGVCETFAHAASAHGISISVPLPDGLPTARRPAGERA